MCQYGEIIRGHNGGVDPSLH